MVERVNEEEPKTRNYLDVLDQEDQGIEHIVRAAVQE